MCTYVRYGNGWGEAVTVLNDTNKMLTAAGDALVSVEAVPISTHSATAHVGQNASLDSNPTCSSIPHFEPGIFAARNRMPLSQAIQLLQSPPPRWHHYINLDAATGPQKGKGARHGSPMHRAPLDKLQPPSFVPLGRGIPNVQGEVASAEINLWLGGGFGTTQLHVDPCADFNFKVPVSSMFCTNAHALCRRRYDNVITVIKGTKHVVLFDPSAAPALRLNGGVFHVAKNGLINYQNNGSLSHFSAYKVPSRTDALGMASGSDSGPDIDGQCRDYQDAATVVLPDGVRSTTVTLNSGEALFLPAGWAHQVTSEPPTSTGSDRLHVAINTWFAPAVHEHSRHHGDGL